MNRNADMLFDGPRAEQLPVTVGTPRLKRTQAGGLRGRPTTGSVDVVEDALKFVCRREKDVVLRGQVEVDDWLCPTTPVEERQKKKQTHSLCFDEILNGK